MKIHRQDQHAVKPLTRLPQYIGLLLAVCALCLFGASPTWAASGAWTNRSNSVWSEASNWASGTVADGADMLADFSTLGSGVVTLNVTLDSARTLGNLKFGSATNLFLAGANTLTLQNSTNTPTITGTANLLCIGAPLASSQQVYFTGGTVALTNAANSLGGGIIFQNNPFGFLDQAALGSGTIQVGNAAGGNSSGSGQCGFDALSKAAAGSAPVTLANSFVIRTIRWIVGQQSVAGLNPQPLIINGDVTLDMGTANVRDIYAFQPLTINGVLHGGQSGTSAFGLSLASGTVTLTNPGNDFTGGITFTGGATLGVNSIGALGDFGNRITFKSSGATLRVDGSFAIPDYQGPSGIGVNVGANSTINCLSGDLQIDAIVQGFGTLTKSGTGKLTLTAANTFSGPINVYSGTLHLSGSGTVATTGGIVVDTNAVFILTDSASAPAVASLTIKNGGQFTMQGSSTLNNAAAITVNSGCLVDFSGLSSAFTLASGGSLVGGGNVNGSVIASSGSVIVPGAIGTVGTLSITNDLTLSGQSLNFDLRNDLTEGGGINDEILVGGSLTLTGGEKIYLNYLDGQLAAGTYTLVRYGSGFSGSFSLGANYPNVTLDQTSTPGAIRLVVSGGSVANNLIWKGDGSANVWDINTAANWVTNWESAAIVYTDPSKVTFDDNGSNSPAVSLNTIALPNAVTFANNAKAYTLAGSGRISGSVGLTLKGTGRVTLAQDNDYSGGTTFTTNGVLELGNGGATGSAGSGTISMGSVSPQVLLNHSVPFTVQTMTGSGGSPMVVQNGTGVATLGGSSDNANLGAVVNSSTLILGKASSSGVHAIGKASTVNSGGTLQLGGTGGDQIYSGAKVTLAGGIFDAAGFSEGFTALNGQGTVTDSAGGGVQTLTGSPGVTASGGTLVLNNASLTCSGAPGLVADTGGTMSMESGTVNITGGANTSNGVKGGGVFNMSGGTYNSSTYFNIGGSPVAFFNLSGGTFNNGGEFLQGFSGPGVVTVGGNGSLVCHFFSYGNNPVTNYFLGGVTTADTFHQRGDGAWEATFNGGTIRAKSTQANFWPDSTTTSMAKQHAYISTNGLIIDCQTFNIGVAQSLGHDPAMGAIPDGGLTKLGSGTLTLSGINSFSGSISNTAGVLAFNNVGSYNNVFIGDNATNQINITSAGTSLTNNTLALGASRAATMGLSVNLGSLGAPSLPVVTVKGTVTNSGNVVVTLSAPVLLPGTIPLVKYGSFDAASFAGTWSVSPFPYVSLTLTNDTASHLISVIVVPGIIPTWKGNVSSAWDTTTYNWLSNGVSAAYIETAPPGEPVKFDDSASSFVVDVSTAAVNPLFVIMTNKTDYSLTGTLGLGGTGALVKSGTGALILNNSGGNTYSGITTVDGGSLVANAANVLSPNSTMTFNNSKLDVGNNDQSIGTITLNNSPLLGTGILTGGKLTFNSGVSNFTPGVVFAGSLAFTMNGTGEMVLTNDNSFSGAVLMASGTLRVKNGNALGLGGFTGENGVTVQPGARVILDGSFSIPEQFSFSGSGPDGVGSLVVTNGDVVVNGSPCGVLSATIYVADKSSVTFQGAVGGNSTKFFQGSVTKSGPGPLIMDAGGNNPTAMIVAQGSMVTSNTTTTGSVTVKSGAALAGSGTYSSALTVEAGAWVTPDQNNNIGTLTSSGGFTNAGTMVFQVVKNESTTNADQVVCTSAFANTGTIVVTTNIGTTLAFASGDAFKLFSLTDYSPLTGVVPSLPALPTGLSWSNNLAVDGTITVYGGVSTTPFDITCSFSGTSLTLQWPSDHIGWRLLCQTNHLDQGISTNTTDWDEYPGASSTSQVTIPVDPTKQGGFFRMIYP